MEKRKQNLEFCPLHDEGTCTLKVGIALSAKLYNTKLEKLICSTINCPVSRKN